jgi:hypothetical protein
MLDLTATISHSLIIAISEMSLFKPLLCGKRKTAC